MSKTIEQLLFQREKLLQANPHLRNVQKQIDLTLEGETPVEKCTMLINLCYQQVRLLQDSMALVTKDVEELKTLCSDFQLNYLK